MKHTNPANLITELSLEAALKIVRAAGYRATKPKAKRKLTMRGPTCVVAFADGNTCRMTTHCHDDALDYDRGIRLCVAAWSSRTKMPEFTHPTIYSVHFERDGVVVGQREAA